MKYPDYYDRILARHEEYPSDYALEKVAYKEAVFRAWCTHKERVRDIIQARREKQERERMVKEKSRSISRLIRVMNKVSQRKSAIFEERSRMKTKAKMMNGKGGLGGNLTTEVNETFLSSLSDEELIVQFTFIRWSCKQAKEKKARKFIEEMLRRFEAELASRGIPTDPKTIQELLEVIPEEVKATASANFRKGMDLAARGKKI